MFCLARSGILAALEADELLVERCSSDYPVATFVVEVSSRVLCPKVSTTFRYLLPLGKLRATGAKALS